jgi:hypothetical protein
MNDSPGELLITVVIADLSLSHTGRSFVVTCTFGPHSPNQTKPLHRRFSEIATPTPFTQTIPYHHRHRIALHCRRQQLEKRESQSKVRASILHSPQSLGKYSPADVFKQASGTRTAKMGWSLGLAARLFFNFSRAYTAASRPIQSQPHFIHNNTCTCPIVRVTTYTQRSSRLTSID